MTPLAPPAVAPASTHLAGAASTASGRFRHQLPVFSPLDAGALVHAALTAAGRRDSRPELIRVLANRYLADEIVLCGSGTDALGRAIRGALDLRGGGTVALPAYSCYDVATSAVGAGARVVLYDLDPVTLGPDPDSFRRALANAGAAVVAPLYGLPLDWPTLAAIADAAGTLLIEDASQGHGASFEGRPLGSLGDLSVLSFGRGKGWTGGSGGALLSRSREVSGIFRESTTAVGDWGQIARAAIQCLIGRPELYWLPASLPWLGLGETVYHDPSPPRVLGAASASILLRTLDGADAAADHRRRIGARYRVLIDDHVANLRSIRPLPGASPGYLRYPVRLRGGIGRLGGRRAALRRGIGPAYPRPLGELPALQSRLIGGSVAPGAAALVQELLTLPTHSYVGAGEAEDLVAWMARTIG